MQTIFTIIGAIGTICFALSGLPQAIKSYKDSHSNGIATATVWLWLIGESAMLIYAIYYYTHDYVLLINYISNTILVGIITYYKYFGKNVISKS